ncbi:phosphopantetheine-binding protein [Streptomyces sp. NPDC005209]|uniref:phosphopantetheine-binding protein n=1 Tax=Streptomyces sp. NPDC005209 TaxID=3156715 RepID=UPI0033B05C06
MKAQAQPTDETSAVIAQEMGQILSTGLLDKDRDFFLAGGDSVRAVELITRIVERFRGATDDDGKVLGAALLLAVFDDASPEALAAVVDEHV